MKDALDIERDTIWQSILSGRRGAVRIVGGRHQDHGQLAELLDRYIAVRRQHWEPEIGEAWQPNDWRQRLRERHPGYEAWIDHGPGWADIHYAAAGWVEEAGELLKIADAKEKWGRLDLSSTSWFEGALEDIQGAMETLSGHICMECGAPGRCRPKGWILTLCDDCEGKRR